MRLRLKIHFPLVAAGKALRSASDQLIKYGHRENAKLTSRAEGRALFFGPTVPVPYGLLGKSLGEIQRGVMDGAVELVGGTGHLVGTGMAASGDKQSRRELRQAGT